MWVHPIRVRLVITASVAAAVLVGCGEVEQRAGSNSAAAERPVMLINAPSGAQARVETFFPGDRGSPDLHSHCAVISLPPRIKGSDCFSTAASRPALARFDADCVSGDVLIHGVASGRVTELNVPAKSKVRWHKSPTLSGVFFFVATLRATALPASFTSTDATGREVVRRVVSPVSTICRRGSRIVSGEVGGELVDEAEIKKLRLGPGPRGSN
jgi:hypothetical protein